VVLAAGAGSRFGGGKMLAPLAGRPILQHTLDALAAARVTDVVVVLGTDAAEVERAIEWRSERRVVNATPAAGLAGSLRVGLASTTATDPAPGAVLVVLGDQPLLDAEQLRRLVTESDDESHPFVVPEWSGGGSPNPVLLLPDAWALVDEAAGDRGMASVMAARPDLVRRVPLNGRNVEVDTQEDLRDAEEALGQSRRSVRPIRP
jgi:CTP:molybdopterin cytidylyltransferase MocA